MRVPQTMVERLEWIKRQFSFELKGGTGVSPVTHHHAQDARATDNG